MATKSCVFQAIHTYTYAFWVVSKGDNLFQKFRNITKKTTAVEENNELLHSCFPGNSLLPEAALNDRFNPFLAMFSGGMYKMGILT